ncbi:Kiwa anti-phage protein KwaB-like domain-containing protein [Georgenia satyanarayanai]|uniref:Kiwa anti-phage protein KwaB-like domain-containing protein n=1 Tax=Georgenia satyanarayanai TaxID=860221 RepID=UPI001264C2BD|nr:Kiwa anti-phage protein KwaB-like domain-containing protein [Georgenia satyanarayanai]
MSTPDVIAEQLTARLAESVSLAVGRFSDDSVAGERLALSRSTAEALRGIARPMVDRLRTARAVPYTAGNEVEGEEYFLVSDAETLADLGPFRRLALNLGSMPMTRPADLDGSLDVTAAGFGDEDAARVVAVQKADPRRGHRGGRFFALGAQQLTLLDEPLFAFSPRFDFVVGPDWAVVLNQRAFESLLRHVSQVEKRIGGWVSSITTHLPMAPGSADALRAVAMRDSRTWRRLREISHRGHLSRITVDQVRAYSVRVGLDADTVVQDGQLVFDPAERFGFLHLLNEDLYRGDLTDEVYEAQRKAPT